MARNRDTWTWWQVVQTGTVAWGVWKQRKRLPERRLPRADVRDLNNSMLRIEAAIHPALDAADLRLRGESHEQTAPSWWKQIGAVALTAAREWIERRAPSKGAALALYTLFSLAPMLVLVVAMAGIFFGADNVRTMLVEQMQGLMGAQGGEAIRTILAGTQQEQRGWWAGIISGALVLVSATTAFGELKNSLDELWEVPASESSGIWSLVRERVLSFGLVAVLALMLMITLVISTALAALQNLWTGSGELETVWHTLLQVLSWAVSFGIVTMLFAAIFKYLPNTDIGWKDVLIGALITAALFTLGKTAIAAYVASADIDSAYGAAGSIVILITWVYYSAQIFFYGALFTHEYTHRIGSKSAQARRAVPVR